MHAPRSCIGVSLLKSIQLASPLGIVRLRRSTKENKRGTCLLVADGDRVAIVTSNTGSGNAEVSDSGDQSSPTTLPSLDVPVVN